MPSLSKLFSAIFLAAALISFLCNAPAFAQGPCPLTLSEGLKIVTNESRVVQIARLSEDMAVSDVKIARSAMLPSINASAQMTALAYQPAMVTGGTTVSTSSTEFASYSISIEQILFDFRAGLSRYDASRMMLEAQKHDTSRIRNAAALEFTSAFYDYLESTHLIETAAKETQSVEGHLHNATRLYESGIITRNDLLQAQVRLSDSRQRLLSAQNLQSVCAAKLNHLLNRPMDTEVHVLEAQMTIVPPAPYIPQEYWKEASRRRPEILIVDRTIDAVDHEILVNKSQFLPRFYVHGANEYTENPYQRHESNWLLIFGVSMNLFEGGKTLAGLQKSQSRKQQLLEQRARLADAIRLEIRQYSLHTKTAYARFEASQDAADQARENLRINQRRYDQGMGTATEVLDAIALKALAETNHIRSVYDCRRAEAALHYAIGRNLADIYR